MKLTDKVAIVTGSTRGIGQAIAMKFAAEGAAVVVTARHIEQAQQVVGEIKNQGGTAIAFKTDVANRADVHNLIKGALEHFKSIHIFVNNAGFARPAPFMEVTEEDWDAVIDVDLKGVFNCTQEVLSHMMEQRYGKIINISSVGGAGFPRTDLASYGPAKAGVIMLTKITAMAAGPYGINVNCIAPGLIRTEMTYPRKAKTEAQKLIQSAVSGERDERTALGRVGKPEDIANLALFLASDDSSFITGQTICCDGGRHDRM